MHSALWVWRCFVFLLYLNKVYSFSESRERTEHHGGAVDDESERHGGKRNSLSVPQERKMAELG